MVAGLAGGGMFMAASTALPQGSAPDRPVRLIVPFAPGGINDTVARPLAERMRSVLGNIVVENRAGAGGTIGAAVVARAEPDGNTLLLGGSSTLALNPAGYKSLSYDVNRDFVSIAKTVSNYHLIVARKDFGPSTMAATMALAKTKAEAVTYASTGVGSPTHFAGLTCVVTESGAACAEEFLLRD